MPERRPQPEAGIPARYPFTCEICDQEGGVGERIVHQAGHYVHAACHQREHE